jgi:uncharacterized protein (UPF0548 family)
VIYCVGQPSANERLGYRGGLFAVKPFTLLSWSVFCGYRVFAGKSLGMFLLFKPNQAQIASFLKSRTSDDFSYKDVGATRDLSPPAGFIVDHNREMLGHGREIFEKAKQAVRQWKMFEVPGLELIRSDTPIEPGSNVVLFAHHLGFHSLSSCRIVYVIDEADRFGFAYGTLTEHVESGEERFTVEYHPDTDEVWYDIYAFSRPGHLFVKLGYPYARRLQKSFAVGSKAAMKTAVAKLVAGS